MFNGTPLHGRSISVKLDDFIQQAAGLGVKAEEAQQPAAEQGEQGE
jgi:hypothetical protein